MHKKCKEAFERQFSEKNFGTNFQNSFEYFQEVLNYLPLYEVDGNSIKIEKFEGFHFQTEGICVYCCF